MARHRRDGDFDDEDDQPRRRKRRDDDADDQSKSTRRGMPGWVWALTIPGGIAVVCVMVCGGCFLSGMMSNTAGSQPNKGGENAAQVNPGRGTVEKRFGELVEHGDLRITVVKVVSHPQLAGRYNGQFRNLEATFAHIQIENVSQGKIADWSGWQGQGEVTDEHGNRFRPITLRGWKYLPWNNTLGGEWDGDFSTRIPPGKYENAAYFEYAPPTSRQVVVSFPLDGQTVRFRGPITTEFP